MTNYDYLFDKTYYGEELTVDHRIERDLYWSIIPNGVVLPHDTSYGRVCGGITDEGGNYIDGSGLHKDTMQGYEIGGRSIEKCDEDIVFLGLWPNIWGHCLTDNIRRLWVLDNEQFMKQYGHLRFLYVPFFDEERTSNLNEMLSILGADKIRLEPISSITRFRNIILPDECFWREDDGTRFFSKDYVEMIDKIRGYGEEHFQQMDFKKVYYSYRNYSAGRTIGEYKLERFFSEIGYTIIHPEEYTFKHQLNILLSCEEFAATAGSLSHNGVFLRDGTRMYLIPRAYFITEYQLALDQVHDIDVTYIDSALSFYVYPDRKWEGPFYYIISHELERCFDHRTKQKNSRLEFYIYQRLGYGQTKECGLPEYYRDIYKEYINADPKWNGKDSLSVNFLKRRRSQRLIAKYF